MPRARTPVRPDGRSRFCSVRCVRMNDDQLLRYSRHILLDEIGIEGQQRLLRGACAGDRRRRPRLAGGAVPRHGRRRPHHAGRRRHASTSPTCSGRSRTTCRASASRRPSRRAQRSRAINPDVQVRALVRARRRGDGSTRWCADADVVLDCSDNFATRQAVNAACVRARASRWSPGAAIGFDGQISVYDTRAADVAVLCLRVPARRRVRGRAPARRWACSRRWSASSAAMQAAEALKLLAGIGSSLAGRLQMLDARTMEWTEIAGRARPATARSAPARPTAATPTPGVAAPRPVKLQRWTSPARRA